MKKVTLEKVQARLGEYVKASAKQPVLILQGGEPIAILVDLERVKKRSPVTLQDVLKRAWKDYERNGGMTHKEFWDDFAKEKTNSQEA